MKKYKINYIINFIIILIIILTKGIQIGLTINEFSPIDKYMTDGLYGYNELLIYNVILISISICNMIYITTRKDNNIRFKKSILIIYIILILITPIGIQHYSGGFAGIIDGKTYISIINSWLFIV